MGLSITPLLQRQPVEEEEEELQNKPLSGQMIPLVQRQPIEEEEEEEVLQPKEKPGPTPTLKPGITVQIDSLRDRGQILPQSERSFFETRFGYDFSQVRIHTNPMAQESANALNARAYTVGESIFFGPGQYALATSSGRRLLAHELTHVLQQTLGTFGRPGLVASFPSGLDRPARNHTNERTKTNVDLEKTKKLNRTNSHGSTCLQRLVRKDLVTCPTGQYPYSADKRASLLLENAIKRIEAAMASRAVDPNDPDVLAVSSALWTAFRLDAANNDTWTVGAPLVKLPVILRRLEIAKAYIDNVVFTFNCVAAGASHTIPGCLAGTCDAGDNAFSCHANTTEMVLCPPFWTHDLNQQGRILVHEVLHINFGFINDWQQPDVHNAHCYAQFVALLNGFNSPADRRCH